MASACVNNIGMLPDNFIDCSSSSPFPSYGWFSPRISFSREVVLVEEEEEQESKSKSVGKTKTLTPPPPPPELDSENLVDDDDICVSGKDVGDFEFRLEDPVKMLPADELFSDGKLVPLQLSSSRCHHHHHHHHQGSGGGGGVTWSSSSNHETIQSPETVKIIRRRVDEVADTDLYLFSPKAPRCTSRWKELLGLKKLQQNANKNESQKSSSSLASKNFNSSSSIKHFLLQRNTKSSSSIDSSLSLPLLRDSDSETVPNVSSGSSSISSSSSSSSSSSLTPNLEELPRFSIDSDPKILYPISINRNPPPRVRLAKPRTTTTTTTTSENHKPPFGDHPTTRGGVTRSSMHRAPEQNQIPSRGVSIDSPRMNSSGKIVFQSLERSSSSPSTFNGGPRIKHRGVERSYSANVRVTPVLNVPVCSLRGSSKSGSVFGFGQLFSSPQKRDGAGAGAAATVMRSHTHTNTNTNRNRTDRN